MSREIHEKMRKHSCIIGVTSYMKDKSKIDIWIKTDEKAKLKALADKKDKSMTTLLKEAVELLFNKYEKDLSQM